MKLLQLALDWNYLEGANDIFKHIQISSKNLSDNASEAKSIGREYYPGLFAQALKKNRPQFVDYFLRRYYNPLDTVEFVKDEERKGKFHTRSSLEFMVSVVLYHQNQLLPLDLRAVSATIKRRRGARNRLLTLF